MHVKRGSSKRGRALASLGLTVSLGSVAALVASSAAVASASTSHRSTASKASVRAVDSRSKSVSIAFVSGPLTDSFFPPLYDGAKQAAADLGIKFNYIPIDEADIEQSSAQTLEAAIASHPSAIVVGDFVPGVDDPLIKQAVKKGIPVYVDQSGGSSWQTDGAFGFIGQPPVPTGEAAGAQLIAKHVKNAVCVNNVPANPLLAADCAGLAHAMKKAGGTSTELPIPSEDTTNPQAVTSDIGAFLASHPSVTGILTLNPGIGSNAVAAVDAAHLQSKDTVGTLGFSTLVISQLESGALAFTINEQPYLDGFLGMMFAYNYAKYGLSPVGPVATGPAIVSRQNLSKWAAIAKQYPEVLGAT